MDLVEGLQQHFSRVVYWWGGYCAIFFLLTRLWPCNPGRSWWNAPRAAFTDLVYGVALLPVVGFAARISLLWVGVTILYARDATPEFTARGWPLWVQCVLILLIQDAIMYWIHRLFHTRTAWKFHAIHHSPETLDWTASSRFHPVNEIGQYAFVDAVVLLMGFSPLALATLMPLNSIYSVLVHANLNWTFGPLKYVFASPVFHRWHHSSQPEAIDKNFAPMFPYFDLICGTFYMPRGVVPEAYGANEPDMPAGPIGQTLFPFRGAGAWAMRRPAVAVACLMLSVGVCYSIWQRLEQPLPTQTVAGTDTSSPDEPPALLPAALVRDPRQTTAAAVNASGLRAVQGRSDGSISLRDLAPGRQMELGDHKSRINALSFSPDGNSVAAGTSDGCVLVCNPSSGEAARTLTHGNGSILCVAASDEGWVAAGGSDGMIRLWDSSGRPSKQCRLDATPINSIALSGAGRLVVASQGAQVTSWDVGSDLLTRYQRLPDLAYCVGADRDGRRIAAGAYNGQLYVWERDREQPRQVLDGHTGPIYALCVEPGGETIVTGGADAVVRVWDGNSSARAKELHGHPGWIFSVSYDAKHQRIVAGGKDGKVTTWDVARESVVPVSGTQP
jgi:sterol desaturase/sphingolipid hydroxylase (fatty acid hydroxylase superfamily)